MANLPAVPNQSSDLTDAEYAIAEALAKGVRPDAIAKRIYPDDLKARRRLRRRLWHKVRKDAKMQGAIGERAAGELLLGLGPAAEALARRAQKGRPDAIKLLMEATGFHNPRVKHEHSGDIKVTLDMPRPARIETTDANDEDIVDAEVVDD